MESSMVEPEAGTYVTRNIKTRNMILETILHILRSPSKSRAAPSTTSAQASANAEAGSSPLGEEIQRILGYDWLLSLMMSHLDAQTVILANSILLHLVASPTGHMRFRDGTHVGGWLEGAESVAQNRQQLGVLIGSPSNA